MILQLDPRYPLVWRTPTQVQLGVASPRAVVEVSPALEHILYAIRAGVPRAALTVIGTEVGVDDAQIDAFVEAVRPALRSATAPERRSTLTIEGTGPTAEIVRRVHGADIADDERPDIAILIAHFVVDPVTSVRWLSRDVPHLPVVFSDAGATIGPLVRPGVGPCLHCLDRERADEDPSWTAIATQLLGVRSTLDREPFATDVAAVVTRVLRENDRAGEEAAAAVSITVSPNAPQSVRVHRPHRDCACRSLAESETAREPGAALPQPTTA
ncbi:bacteriocin biosynthesis cyclodehydratase domain-containing protein [Paramicrobacterium humi]|uniref:Bacteriocin biosynthesis cyclodehydratase domain-containing protein n=1 Tax=Paramicrobacterium humi TaxID=640635 RepID=A0A1H4T9R6_9MICO|nr:bacteriocin biosynthesis cyclodehydratase domain-containing protein [Microbacterium humi]